MNTSLLQRLLGFLRKPFWWRPYYFKFKLEDPIAAKGRCLQCHAGVKIDPDVPRCSRGTYPCPCKYNECLKNKPRLS